MSSSVQDKDNVETGRSVQGDKPVAQKQAEKDYPAGTPILFWFPVHGGNDMCAYPGMIIGKSVGPGWDIVYFSLGYHSYRVGIDIHDDPRPGSATINYNVLRFGNARRT